MSGTAGGTSATDREPGAPITLRSASSRRAGLLVSGLVVAGCLAAAGCTTDEAKIDPKLGVSPSPRVVGSGEPVPKGGGRYLTGKPYKIGGRWFSPMDNPTTDYEVIGVASWYGPGFHGRRTANGEVFDAKSLSAAHPTLPLPSYIRVTNLNNDRSIIVRVNDRGPFHGRRVIDVSSLAAEKLDFKRKGMARVRVEYVGPASLDGSDHQKLLASYRGPGEGPAVLPGSPEARSVLIASAETETRAEDRRPAAAAPRPTRTTEIMLARSGRSASPIAVLQRAPKPAAPAPQIAPAAAADPRTIELAAATPETLPGVGSALAGSTDPAVADPTLAATTDLAMASTAGMILPRPRPGAVGTMPAATDVAALPAAEPAVAAVPVPAAEPQGWAVAEAPATPVEAGPMQVASLAYAPMPAPKPSAARTAAPASYVPPAPAPVQPAPAAAAPSSIDDLLSPASTMPASGFQPMPLSRAPSYAAAPRRGAADDALARFIAAQAGER